MAIKTFSQGIMSCPLSELETICEHFLTSFDNYQQIFYDLQKPVVSDYFVKAYEELDEYYRKIKAGIEPGIHQRNQLRMHIKYAEKHAQSELLEEAV